eukprot:4214549-Pleurochrysis_carterae.AAC.1
MVETAEASVCRSLARGCSAPPPPPLSLSPSPSSSPPPPRYQPPRAPCGASPHAPPRETLGSCHARVRAQSPARHGLRARTDRRAKPREHSPAQTRARGARTSRARFGAKSQGCHRDAASGHVARARRRRAGSCPGPARRPRARGPQRCWRAHSRARQHARSLARHGRRSRRPRRHRR